MVLFDATVNEPEVMYLYANTPHANDTVLSLRAMDRVRLRRLKP